MTECYLSTGGTVAAAVRALLAAGWTPDISVVMTHGLLRTRRGGLSRSANRLDHHDRQHRATSRLGLPLQIVSLAPLLAEVIRRLDRDEPVSDLISHG